MPRVSVLMPVYNAERYLAGAVESILSQTYEDFELIVINDGSTDGSEGVLRRYAERDTRMRLISRPNTGLVGALNEMLGVARGAYLARMDADDLSMPNRLARQVAFLDDHAEAVAVGGAFALIDNAGRRLTVLRPPVDDADIQRLLLEGHAAICHPAVMMRREAVERIGGYDPETHPAEDVDLFLRLGEIGTLVNLPDVVLQYRLHPGSISERAGRLQRERGEMVCRRAWARRGISGEYCASTAWRPDATRESQAEFALKYGWWAFNSGERRTAAIYGAKAVRLAPWRLDGWKLLVCAVVKRSESAGA